ncbi:MAG: OmpA family protein [Gammaproteobacteria bacterium]
MKKIYILLFSLSLFLAACSSTADVTNHNSKFEAATGASVLAAVGVGAGIVADADPYVSASLGVIGAGLGYYLGSLKPQARYIWKHGGEVYQVGDYVLMVLPIDSIFEPGSVQLIARNVKMLDEAGTIIRMFTDQTVLVTVSSDGVGTDLFEAKLSDQRAHVVTHYFKYQALKLHRGQRFYAMGLGDTDPVSDLYTSRGMMLNRRVEITIFPNGKTPPEIFRHFGPERLG